MQCSRCQQDNLSHAKFCLECGTPLGPSGLPAPSYADVQRLLTEATEQQTAMAEILQAISQSLTNLQPVLNTVAARAAKLCDALDGVVLLADGDALQVRAYHGYRSIGTPVATTRVPINRGSVAGRAFVDREAIHVPDLLEASDLPEGRRIAQQMGHRTALAVPLLREGVSIGVIFIRRTEVRLFTDRHIELLKTFAHQAVIAIENARLFNQTKEALEQQTATAEILRVISGSPTDLQPVLDAVASSAARLCEAADAVIQLRDGDQLVPRAHFGPISHAASVPIVRGSVSGRVAIDGRTIHIHDLTAIENDDEFPVGRAFALQDKVRTHLAIPLLREGIVLGVILIRRAEVRPFSEAHISLLQTFADQAVIAIENVRLFNETKEALERQTATSEILRVISSSPTDVQPVLDAVAESATRLCGATDALVYRVEAGMILRVAHFGPLPSVSDARPVTHETVTGHSILERRAIHVHDLLDELAHGEYAETQSLQGGIRTVLCVPLTREDLVLGAITIRRTQVDPFTEPQIELVKTFADQAVIAIENVRLFTELQTTNRDLTTALEQQTATSDLLKVIGRSAFDLQPVFETLAKNAVRLCEAERAFIFRFDGEVLRVAATHNVSAARREFAEQHPIRPGRHSVGARAALERRTIHIQDIQADSEYTYQVGQADPTPTRTVLSVPMLRAEELLGVITIFRYEVRPFSESQIALMETFADQAVIAIENVRLFNETKEALEQQTATAEILRVISSSPTDIQPVLDAVVRSATRLCEGYDAWIGLTEGGNLRVRAHQGPIAIAEELRPIRRGRISENAVLDRRTIHVHDLAASGDEFPQGHADALRIGHRTTLGVPLLREGQAIGVIMIRRLEVRPFTDNQIALLQTFADQAVIAIENVRLFTELQTSNRDLTTALDKQTATSDILRVISRSQTDVQPVFDAILSSAVRLLGAYAGVLTRIVDDRIELAALTRTDADADVAVKAAFPQSLQSVGPHPQAIRDRAPVNIADSQTDPRLPEDERARARARGYRSRVLVPMLRHDEAVGTISVARREPGGFTGDEIALLQTFADQAVIAIENVRLFKELEARTHDLTRSVGELRALNEVGQAISSTLDLQAVLTAIVARATQLSDTDAGVIYEYDQPREVFLPRATAHLEAEIVETMLATPVRKGEGASGRLAEVPEPIQVPDILAAPAESRVRGALVRAGYRALLAVPLVREGHLIGGLTVIRRATGAFGPESIELLQTFATQSSLAIQNARLFREIEEKSRQLEVASQHKSEFLANMSHELRTPLNAIIGFSEVLSERMFGELNEKQEEYLRDIYGSGQHLLSLINDILDLSKIEAGRMELELTDFHLPTALDSALTLVRERAGRRGIALQMNVNSRLGQIQADERKVRQVVLNLLSNAIKFTPEAGRIEVGAVPKDGVVEVSVSDTGIGIAPEDQEKVFEEFRQVGTAAKKVEGTGLGLTLCRKFVELHGGRIWVKSHLGQGSTFTFTIPVRRGA